MAYDSAATRARLLTAAHAEFVEHGLAGARVDRIAKNASANKQAIYAYFGSKESLFDAVLGDRLGVLSDAVPFTAEDLASYAGALFDELTADPALQRLTQWKVLERPEASQQELDAHLAKAQALAEEFECDIEAAMDVLLIVLAAAQAWNLTPPGIRTPIGRDDKARRARHRMAVVAAARATANALLLPEDR
ncbi:AcrR family transcriptional regulator [Crossiella equi]|uniref:AcrR family transcriptional regulator n=1 Tax=Crossiella equi TaxID=130796 RepID=A0ABS5APU7_9PSEU|nr:TetR family transcriptional regulator [Crossiella equi]MBP2478590.1 AcrR family transcriptional regulator [Crossiella equi]